MSHKKIDDNVTLLWTYRMGKAVDYFYDSLRRPTSHICVSVSSNGSYIAAGLGDLLEETLLHMLAYRKFSDLSYGKVCLFNREGKLLWSYEPDTYVHSISISSDGSYIAVGSRIKIYFFNKAGTLLWSTQIEKDGWIESVSVSSYGSYIVAGSGDKKVYFFNREGKLLWTYKTVDSVDGVSVSPDGTYIVAGAGKAVYIFNQEGNLLWNLYAPSYIRSVSSSFDASYIAVASLNDNSGDKNKLNFFSRKGKMLWQYETDGYVSITSDGSYVATGRYGILLLNGEGKLLWNYKTSNFVTNISISSEGSYIAFGTMDRKVYLFKLDDEFVKINKVKRKEVEDKVEVEEKKADEKRILANGTKRKLFEKNINIKIPDTIKYGYEVEVKIDVINTFDEPVEAISIDLSEASDYFELSEKMIKFPQLKSNMRLGKTIKFKPLYEGNISFTIRIKSSLGETVKDFTINVMAEK